MTTVLGRRSGFLVLSLRMDMDRRLHSLTFSARDLNDMERASLVSVGHWFIRERLGLRFDSSYARPKLGYTAQAHDDFADPAKRKRGVLSRAMSSGMLQRLADKFWRGWNPWKTAEVPGPLWTWWIREQQAAGRFEKTRTGYFKTARKELRQLVKDDLRRRIDELSAEGEIGEKRPLISSGRLHDAVMSGSRASARASASTASLKISMPAPPPRGDDESSKKAIYHPIVGAVLQRMAAEEIVQAERVYVRSFEALLGASSTTIVPSGPQKGVMRRSLTAEQRASIAHTKSPSRAAERPSIA